MSIKNPILIAAAIALLSGVAAVSHSIAQNAPMPCGQDGNKPGCTNPAGPNKMGEGKMGEGKEGYGRGRGGFVPDYIKELDKNSDGTITKEEYDTWRYNYPRIEAERFRAELDAKRTEEQK